MVAIAEFFCERKMVEEIMNSVQKNFLIQQYCGEKFVFVNMVDVYYRVYKSNAVFALFLNMIIFLMFWNTFPSVIYRMLCPSVISTIKSLKIGKVYASLTITVIINLMPNFYTFARIEKQNNANNITNLQWVLAETLIVLNLAIGVIVISDSRVLVLSKWIFLKDSFFILGTLVLFIVYGFISKIDYTFVIILFTIFLAYMVCSVIIEYKRWSVQSELALEIESKDDRFDEEKATELEEEKRHVFNPDESVNKDEDEDEEDKSRNFDWDKFYNEIKNEVTFAESGFIMNCILVTPMALALLSIPYYKNPLMSTPVRYIVFFMASSIILFNFHLKGVSIVYRLFISLMIALIYLVINMVNLKKTIISYLTEFMGYLSAISYAHILLLLCLDSLAFIGFYFSGKENLTYNFWPASLSGSFMLFTAIGYSMWGRSLLGVYSCYSSIVTTITLYFGIVCLSFLKQNENDFELFSFKATNDANFVTEERVTTWILLGVFALTNFVQMIYFWNSGFKIGKVYGIITVAIYVIFVIGISAWGIISGNQN